MKKLAVMFVAPLLFVGALSAASKKSVPPASMPTTTMPPAGQPDMAQMMKMSSPGEDHKVFASLVGTWTATSSMWMKPGDQPQISTGTSVQTLELGGRFLKQVFTGTMMNAPFHGVGYTGYDNIRGEYQSIWMDEMMTGMLYSAGSLDKQTNTVTQSGDFSCPMTGEKHHPFRSEMKILDADHYTFAMFDKDPSGKEFKNMQIDYARTGK